MMTTQTSMKAYLYIDRNIAKFLRTFGDLSTVVDSILYEMVARDEPMEHLPDCGKREGDGQYIVEITNPVYIELSELYPPGSTNLSLRRIVYWFVSNEKYIEYGWKSQYVGAKKYLNLTHLFDCFKSLVTKYLGDSDELQTDLTKIGKLIEEKK